MFEFSRLPPGMIDNLPVVYTRQDWEIVTLRTAHNLFRHEFLSATLHKSWAQIRRRAYLLYDLGQVTARGRLLGCSYLGMREISISCIQGSESRCTDFDLSFRPLQKRDEDRWVKIAMLRLINEPLPAVELIQIGETYFVRDGHHRISVARVLENQDIDASVTAWNFEFASRTESLRTRTTRWEA